MNYGDFGTLCQLIALAFVAGVLVGRRSEAAKWRGKAESGISMMSDGSLYQVSKESQENA